MSKLNFADLAAPMSPAEVKEARLALGFASQDGLAEALGLNAKWRRDTVRTWENGRVEITGPARLALRLMLKERGLLDPDKRAVAAAEAVAPKAKVPEAA